MQAVAKPLNLKILESYAFWQTSEFFDERYGVSPPILIKKYRLINKRYSVTTTKLNYIELFKITCK